MPLETTPRSDSAFRRVLGRAGSGGLAVPVLCVSLSLSLAFPRRTEGAALEPPLVSLNALQVTDDAVTARLASGGTAKLTLDPALERAAARLLVSARAKTAALVALDPRTGRLLVWAGARGSETATDAVGTTLSPAASLFKIVTTTALLEKHVSPDRVVCISGGSSRLDEENLERPTAGHALCAPFKEALGRSRNAVFAQLATRFLGRDDLVATGDRFGFGKNAPFDVPTKIGTLDVPDGELPFARAAAGFVGSELSPLGAAHLATTVAALGQVVRLHVVESADGYELPRRRVTLGRVMSEGTARVLERMMEVTIHSGTSREVFSDEDGHSYLGDVRVAGKTGTLQPNADDPTTSWFVGFAPSRAPRVVVAVLLENGPLWRRKANEVGRDFLRVYFASHGTRGVTMPEGL